MDLQIKDHVALIQASSKGIGRGIAEALAAEGVHLVLTGRTEETLKTAASEIATSYNVKTSYFTMDSVDIKKYPKLIDKIKTEFGRLDIVLANSGGPPPGMFEDLKADQWANAFQLLMASPVELLRASIDLLEKSSSPRFFIITSSSTREPVPGLTLSNVFRPGIVALVKEISNQYANKGLRCHSLAPGRIDTDRLAAVFKMQAEKNDTIPDDIREKAIQSIPAGRIGTVNDMGSLATFLASPNADYLTGQNWLVDGGLIKSL